MSHFNPSKLILILFSSAIMSSCEKHKARLSFQLISGICAHHKEFNNSGLLQPPLTTPHNQSQIGNIGNGEAQWINCDQSGNCQPFNFTVYPSAVRKNPEEGEYFEGDILGYPDSWGKAGTPDPWAKWPNNTLYYFIEKSLFNETESNLIEKAIDVLSLTFKGCLKFIPIMSLPQWPPDFYVRYTKVPFGCGSYIGRKGGDQEIRLSSDCFRVGHGTVMHETIHALGFAHEQSRVDRDNYVIIHNDRIIPTYRRNFYKIPTFLTFHVPYDYDSIMHYPKNAFGIQPTDVTIEVILSQSQVPIGQRTHLSALDIQKIKRMYECPT